MPLLVKYLYFSLFILIYKHGCDRLDLFLLKSGIKFVSLRRKFASKSIREFLIQLFSLFSYFSPNNTTKYSTYLLNCRTYPLITNLETKSETDEPFKCYLKLKKK